MALQHIRSSTLDKRPQPASLSDGQLAINTNLNAPGVFFKDSNGALVKVGPTFVGTTAPNSTPGSGGATGNTLGEQWLDTSGGTYVLKIWDGTAWRSEAGEFVNVTGDTMTGALVMDNQQQVRFRETTANGTNYIALQAPASVASDKTITLPDVTGTVVTTGDTGSVTSTMIADGTILNADVNASAAIAGTKISPDFGSQNVTTTGTVTGASLNPTSSTVPTNGVYLPAANSVGISTNGTGRLFINSSGNVGVGTSSPSAKAHLLDSSSVALRIESSGANFVETNFVNTSAAYTIGIRPDTSNSLCIRDASASTTRVVLDTSGRLGIGSTAPSVALEVGAATGAAQVDANVLRINRGVTGQYTTLSSAGGAAVLNGVNGAGGAILFQNDGSEKARIESGRLLVGTSTGTIDFQIKSAGGIQASDGTSEIVLRYNMYWDGSANRYIQAANKASSLVCDNTGSFVFYNTNTASTSAGSTVSGLSQRWKIDSLGSLVGSTGCAFVAPYINDNTTANAANVNVDTSGFLRRSTSSIKYKNNVNNATHGLAELMQLRPVTYTSKAETDGSTVFGGLIAEEVDAVGLSEFVQYAEDGSPDALAYGNMVSLCVKAIQEQQAVIEELQEKVAALKAS
jgi:hypothetical protein